MNDPRDPQNPGPPTFDIPDLDVSEAGRPVSRAPAPQPSAPAPAPAQSSNPADNLFGSGMFDDDHFDAGGVGAIDLGSGHGGGYGPGTSGVYSGGALDDLDDDFHAEAPSLKLASVHPPAPSGPSFAPPMGPGAAPDRGTLGFDPLEIAGIGGYGVAPSAIYLTPMYAYRVFMRQRELRTTIARLTAELSNAEAARDQALANVTEALRPQIEADQRFAPLMAPLRELDGVMHERSAALSSANAQYQSAMTRFDEETAALDNQLGVKQKAADAAQATYDERATELGRVEARYKRIQIEIRNFRQQATGGQPNAPLAPEHAAQIAPLEAQAKALEPELTERRAVAAQARAVLDAAQREVQTIQQGKARVDGQRRQLDVQFRRELDSRAAGVHDAEAKRRSLLAEAARHVIHSGAFDIDEAAKHAIQRADAEVLRATTDHEKHLQALDAYDANVAKKGRTVAIAAAALLLLLLLLILVL